MGKRMKFFMGLFLSLALLQAVFVPFGAGLLTVKADDGSGYIPISTKHQLNDVRKKLGEKYYLVNDIIFTEADFQPGGDFYNGGKGWEPIGSEQKPFTGFFSGGGYVIQGGQINVTDSGNSTIGFIGVNKGNIMELTLWDWNITVDSSNSVNVGSVCGINHGSIFASGALCYLNAKNENENTSSIKIGGITGINLGEIFYCSSLSSIEGYCKTGIIYGGGIAGINNGYISECANMGEVDVSGESKNDHPSGVFAGGIAGLSQDEIRDSINYSGVYGTADNVDTFAGGIAARSIGEIYYCINFGEVYSHSNKGQAISGGVFGEAYAMCDTQQCYNGGPVVARGNKPAFAGGIGGLLSIYPGLKMFINNINTGDVEAISETDNVFAGGIYGNLNNGEPNNKLYGLFNSGNVSGKIASAGLNRECYVGGIVGLYLKPAIISDCVNIGDIKGELHSGSTAGHLYVGGMFGSIEGTVTNCENWGRVESISDYSNITGGIAGELISNGGYLSKCFNAGDVVVSGSTNSAFTGGIAGYLESEINNSYNIGNITVTAKSYASAISGGICGYAYGDASSSLLSKCYNMGIIKNTVSGLGSLEEDIAGGICGVQKYNTDIYDCYFLDNINDGVGQSSGVGAGDTYRKTDAEMKKQNTYVGFDFKDVWKIDVTTDYKYPQLISNTHAIVPLELSITDISEYYVYEGMLIGLRDNTTLSGFLPNFENNDNIIVLDKDNNEVGSSDLIGTEYSVFYHYNEIIMEAYSIVVFGDISGDGKINAADYLMAKRAFMGSVELNPPQMKAACLSGGDTVKAGDYLKIKRHFLGTYDLFYDMLYD